ncbi:SGNH/GDSL hydrolase family protein [Candidatus Poribacteria bacterium]|nr:SGNH/GDSL hydrolase family protein [Candidatus Poribacteria bacterium]
MNPDPSRGLILQHGETVVFMGDSITDAGWRGDSARSLGGGYVAQIADLLAVLHPERSVRIVNHGNSGDRAIELDKRWDEDVIALYPDWISVSIGINDVWRRFAGLVEHAVAIEDYRRLYRGLLERTRARTKAKLILMETSVIGEDLENDTNRYLEMYNQAIHEFAEEFDAIIVPIRNAFRTAIAGRPGFAWTGDGVHPLPPGHMLMAVAWLRAVGALA